MVTVKLPQLAAAAS